MNKRPFLWIILLFCFACNNSGVTPDQGDESGDNPNLPITESLLIHNEDEVHGGWANVGQYPYVNGYRGIYWIGPSCRVDRVEICLNFVGDVSGVEFRMGAWTVDTGNHLQLGDEIAQSNIVMGSAIVLDSSDSNLGGWVTFSFQDPAILATGNRALLIYRVDGQSDIENYIQVNNPYDEYDENNHQANLHYSFQGDLAGRGPGDEDQPEPFAVKIRLYGELFNVPDSQEYPAQPIRVEVLPSSTAGRVDINWEYRSTGLIPSEYRIYRYNMDTGEKLLLGSVPHSPTGTPQLGTVTGTTQESYVLTAVAANGNESYHSLLP